MLFQQRTLNNEKLLIFIIIIITKEKSENFATMIYGYFNDGSEELFFNSGVQGVLPKTRGAHGRQKQGTQQMQRQREKHLVPIDYNY